MDEFCGSDFWDSGISWNTDNPDLTLCFEKTVLVWIPCVFLWILLPFEIYFLRCSKYLDIPWNVYNITKLISIKISAIASFIDIVTNVFLSSSYFPVDLYSPLIKCATLILFFGLTYANVKYGSRSSGVLFLYSLLLVLFGGFQIRTEIRLKWPDVDAEDFGGVMELTSHIIYYSFVLVVFIMNCFADVSPRVTFRPYDEKACPRTQSSFLSRILFAWFEPLVWKGYRKSLKNDDLWTLDDSILSSNIVPRFEEQWNNLLKECGKNTDSPEGMKSNSKYKFDKNKEASIVSALYRTFRLPLIWGTCLKVFLDIFVLVNPQLLSALIDFVDSDEPMWRGYLYAVALFVVAILQSLLLSQYQYLMSTLGLKIRTCLISTIYKKSLRISNGARKNFNIGETVNLMSVDVYRFVDLMPFTYLLISTPVQATLAIYLLWQILGPSALAGLLVIVISILGNGYVASKAKAFQFVQMQKKDDRIKLMNQILSGIKVLKLYAWEPSFEKQVLSIRNEELKILKKQAYLMSACSWIWNSATFLVYLTTFVVYVFSSENNVLNAKIAFVSLSLFNTLRLPLLMVPMMISNLIQTGVAVKRINMFLSSEDLSFNDVTHNQRPEALVFENGSFSWEGSKGHSTLRNINLRIPPGSLVAVIGPVGCGKSSLISAFLGEMYKISGIVNTQGTVAYTPQQAWIRNATLRDNITFGESVEGSRYNEILEACALKPDLKILPAGDLTEIGEKGINLSGGQKQRVSLARAVYNGADVYLLDDPLSAVDSHVGKHIFEQVIGPNGLLKNKTRVLVTHSVTYLSQVDLIVVMKDGSISESGTFDKLLDNKGDFSEFLIRYLEENDDCAKEDFDKLIDILDEKKLTNEKLIRQKSIRSESGSITSFNRQRSINSKKRESFGKRHRVKKSIAGKKLIEEEHIETGNISWGVFAYFVRSVGIFLTIGILFVNCLVQTFSITSNMWLSKWTDDPNATTSEGTQNIGDRNYYVLIYTLLGLSKGLAQGLTSVLIRIACWKSGKMLHNIMLNTLFRLPLSFMDVTPGGRIISRFSKDIDVVDNSFSSQITYLCSSLDEVIATLIIVSCSTPTFIAVIIPIVVLYCLLQRFYVNTSRQLKRLESVSRSPIYSHFVETLVGSQFIRAYGLSEKFIQQSNEKVDLNHQSYYLNVASNRWLAIRSDLLCNLIIFLSALFAVLDRGTISPGVAGLSIGYALQITTTISWSICTASEIESNVVSIERIKQFSETPREAAWEIPDEYVPPKWPSKGEINFQDFQVRYREGLELVLKGISFYVNAGQKVGIVGRTGAGKSSLSLSLFRILESAGGKILIDGVDIATLGLHTVRSRLTIIPQDPVVFAGSLRMNLDPFEEYSDDNIWHALKLAHIKSHISGLDGALEHKVDEGGENFSVGQRQLICLARALLRKTKILILDEATAAVDLETDDLIQRTIREEFKDCTVLTIAHRLNTVMDYDRILVFDEGYVVEHDSPQALLQSKSSLYYQLASDAGLV